MRYLILLFVLLFGCVGQPAEEVPDETQEIMVPEDTSGVQEQPEITPEEQLPEEQEMTHEVLMPENTTEEAHFPHNMTEITANGTRSLYNVRYSNESSRLLLDLHIPESAKPVPLVIFIHGGAWKIGSKEGCMAKPLTQYGYAVACINYRLSDEAIFPAQIEDVKTAVSWLRAYTGKYNIDKDNFGAWGDSAGGHLAALVGTSGEGRSKVQAVCDWFGPTDFFDVENETDPGGKYFDYYEAAKDLVGGPLRDNKELVEDANPITHISSDDPPFLIMHGTNDSTVPLAQSLKLHEALTQEGVNSTLKVVQGGGHGFPLYDASGPSTEFQAVIDFFDDRLRN